MKLSLSTLFVVTAALVVVVVGSWTPGAQAQPGLENQQGEFTSVRVECAIFKPANQGALSLTSAATSIFNGTQYSGVLTSVGIPPGTPTSVCGAVDDIEAIAEGRGCTTASLVVRDDVNVFRAEAYIACAGRRDELVDILFTLAQASNSISFPTP